mmetsp:Transcript_26445/g.47457  ORF Transcript_26445/g.47457 Transcript_26445/m.47457 type:complete len:102 (-) Transcript_26445:1160-1465(-)
MACPFFSEHEAVLASLKVRFRHLLDVIGVAPEELRTRDTNAEKASDPDPTYKPPAFVDINSIPQTLLFASAKPRRGKRKRGQTGRKMEQTGKKRLKVRESA